MTFRFSPAFEVQVIEMLPPPGAFDGHREYRVKCTLTHIPTGAVMGEGVGSASTLETKWRFRSGPTEATDKPVPQEYWNIRKTDPAKAQQLLGGKGFVTKKDDSGKWMIAVRGERVEFDNPADNYNTCLKMAKKRALVDATLTATAASDIFTQDLEEMQENGTVAGPSDKKSEEKPPVQPPQEKKEEKTDDEKRGELTDLGVVYATAKGITFEDAIKEFTVFKGSDGAEKFKEDPKKLSGKWLNSSLGRARELAKPFMEEKPQGAAEKDPDADVPF
jgi:hypothetical protein